MTASRQVLLSHLCTGVHRRENGINDKIWFIFALIIVSWHSNLCTFTLLYCSYIFIKKYFVTKFNLDENDHQCTYVHVNYFRLVPSFINYIYLSTRIITGQHNKIPVNK